MVEYIIPENTSVVGVLQDTSGFITSDIQSIAEILGVNSNSHMHVKKFVEAILQADSTYGLGAQIDHQQLPQNLTFASDIQSGILENMIQTKNALQIYSDNIHGDVLLAINKLDVEL